MCGTTHALLWHKWVLLVFQSTYHLQSLVEHFGDVVEPALLISYNSLSKGTV